MRKPADFAQHPASYPQARDVGLFRAVVKHIVDADTLDVFVDLGLGKYAYETIRVYGADAPEINSGVAAERARGMAARDFVEKQFVGRPYVMLRTYRDAQTFGRYVAEVYYDSGEIIPGPDWRSLADALHLAGHVKNESAGRSD